MNRWIDGWMSGCVNRWMSGCVDGWMSGCEFMDEWVCGWKD